MGAILDQYEAELERRLDLEEDEQHALADAYVPGSGPRYELPKHLVRMLKQPPTRKKLTDSRMVYLMKSWQEQDRQK